MPEQKQLTDRQKLHAYAVEVQKMRAWSKEYHAIAKAVKAGKDSEDRRRAALKRSFEQEKKVDEMTARALQQSMPI